MESIREFFDEKMKQVKGLFSQGLSPEDLSLSLAFGVTGGLVCFSLEISLNFPASSQFLESQQLFV